MLYSGEVVQEEWSDQRLREAAAGGLDRSVHGSEEGPEGWARVALYSKQIYSMSVHLVLTPPKAKEMLMKGFRPYSKGPSQSMVSFITLLLRKTICGIDSQLIPFHSRLATSIPDLSCIEIPTLARD